MKRKYLLGLGLIGAGAAAAYFGRQWYLAARPQTGAKHVSDEAGNYDIDGVSYDRENDEVVVSGDNTRGEDPRAEALLH